MLNNIENEKDTHAGQPIAIANAARIVSPLSKPSFTYIAGAKPESGKPNPASERRQETAASAREKEEVRFENRRADQNKTGVN